MPYKDNERKKEYMKKYNREHKRTSIAHRKYNLKNSYGLTLEKYDEILTSQKNVCAICGRSEKEENQFKKLPLAVDHNHITGQVRGLLCGDCNRAIGNFQVDYFGTLNLEKALSYIQNAKEKNNE